MCILCMKYIDCMQADVQTAASGEPSPVSAIHTCPEAKTQFFELFMDTINGFLLLLSHIKNIDKAWNPEQKEKKLFHF